MRLYTYFRSSSSFRVRIALNLKGIDYEPVFVNLLKGEQRSDAHLARNPLGLIPVLEDGDAMLSQSTAIIEYLEEAKGGIALLPKDPVARAQVRAMVNLVACEIQPINNLATLNYVMNDLGGGEEGRAKWIAHWMQRGFTALEKLIIAHGAKDGYCFGESVTMADVYLVPQLWNARRFNVDLSPYPNITRVEAALYKIDAFKKARPENQPDNPDNA